MFHYVLGYTHNLDDIGARKTNFIREWFDYNVCFDWFQDQQDEFSSTCNGIQILLVLSSM